MNQQDYQKIFNTNVTAKEAFENITNVGDWWTKSFKGSAKNLNDKFEVTFGKTKVNFKVIEVVPFSKLVWLVTDCYLDWLKDKTEWKDTRLVWDISEENKKTKIEMTHVGLVPGLECYKDCEAGWNQYAGESLPTLLATGKSAATEGSRG
jgi:Activator of Hsp90 ATPase homolog 1-like protein